MPDHKHLSHRVRERMSTTDESYSAARRHVLALAADGPPPGGLVPGYDRFGRVSTARARWWRTCWRRPGVGAAHRAAVLRGDGLRARG